MRKVMYWAVVLCLVSFHATGAVWYVDKSTPASAAEQNGLTWATAFDSLQPGMGAAYFDGGGDVWVAKGRYDEERSSMMHDPQVQTGSLVLGDNIRLYGGFNAGDTDFSMRNAGANETIIDGAAALGAGAPAVHVILAGNNAVLDGFTITGGSGGMNGSGLYCEGISNFEAVNCRFDLNTEAWRGGGAYLKDCSNIEFYSCNFTGNSANQGGALYVEGGSNIRMRLCTFGGTNHTTHDGGAIYLNNSQSTFEQCWIRDNLSGHAGGGVFCWQADASTIFRECRFLGNKAQLGGAMFNWTNTSPQIVNSVFFGNSTTLEGGGAIFNNDSASPAITNCSFSGNAAPGGTGGAISNDHNSAPVIMNSILWGNLPLEIVDMNGSAPVVSYSVVQGGYAGESNANTDPLFKDAPGGDLSLSTTPLSPCIDLGNAVGAPDTDIGGVPRPQGFGVDMGAFEVYQAMLTVSISGEGSVDPFSGIRYYLETTDVALKAQADPGWHFDHWEGPVADTQAAETTISVSANAAVTAVFALNQKTLTMAASGSGTLYPAVGSHAYDEGAMEYITATPAEGWRFDHWTGPVAGANNPDTTVVVSDNITVTALFVQQATLTMAQTGQGTITPAAGAHVYDMGAVVNVTAAAANGWRFVQWVGTVANAGAADTTVAMNGNITVTAAFAQQLTLTVAVEGQGAVDPAAGAHTYDAGATVNLKATPAQDWVFDHWTGPVADTAAAETTVSLANANATVTAVFAKSGGCGCQGQRKATAKDAGGDMAVTAAVLLLLPIMARKGARRRIK